MKKTIFTFNDLLYLDDGRMRDFIGRLATSHKKDETYVRGKITGFISTCNPPHHPVGFVIDEKKEVNLTSIVELAIK